MAGKGPDRRYPETVLELLGSNNKALCGWSICENKSWQVCIDVPMMCQNSCMSKDMSLLCQFHVNATWDVYWLGKATISILSPSPVITGGVRQFL